MDGIGKKFGIMRLSETIQVQDSLSLYRVHHHQASSTRQYCKIPQPGAKEHLRGSKIRIVDVLNPLYPIPVLLDLVAFHSSQGMT